MLHARNKQRSGNNYMMTVHTTYFSTSLGNDADTNGTWELMLLIAGMNNSYVMTEDMKGTATCVVRYERMSITADRHKVPQNTLPSVTSDESLEFNGSAHWPFGNTCSTQSEMWSVEKTLLLTPTIHEHAICKTVLFAGRGYLIRKATNFQCSVEECMELYLLFPSLHDA